MDALVIFLDGSILVEPIERGRPVSGTFWLERSAFRLVDVLPSGRLVFREAEGARMAKFASISGDTGNRTTRSPKASIYPRRVSP
jgi:hypothetical protein